MNPVNVEQAAPDACVALFGAPLRSWLTWRRCRVCAWLQIGTNDDCSSGGTLTSCWTGAATANTHYAIQIDGYGGNMGAYVIVVNQHVPDNDNFAKYVWRALCRRVQYLPAAQGVAVTDLCCCCPG